VKRLLAGLAGAVLLLAPSVPAAAADDDPAPRSWPTIENPGTGSGSEDDPKPVKWPDIIKPDLNSNSNDPKPTEWPAPEPA
jgi:hypothetical protein